MACRIFPGAGRVGRLSIYQDLDGRRHQYEEDSKKGNAAVQMMGRRFGPEGRGGGSGGPNAIDLSLLPCSGTL